MKPAVNDPAQGFEGARVVEYADAGIAAAYAGWLLARMGAQVTRLMGPPSSKRAATSPVQLALDVLADGKASAPCPSTAAELDALLGACDIVLCDTPATLEALAGPITAMNLRWPSLIVGMATTFGLEGPYAGLAGGALDAQALSAVAWCMGEAGREPLSFPPEIGRAHV